MRDDSGCVSIRESIENIFKYAVRELCKLATRQFPRADGNRILGSRCGSISPNEPLTLSVFKSSDEFRCDLFRRDLVHQEHIDVIGAELTKAVVKALYALAGCETRGLR